MAEPPRPARWTVKVQPPLARAKPAPLTVGHHCRFPGARPLAERGQAGQAARPACYSLRARVVREGRI